MPAAVTCRLSRTVARSVAQAPERTSRSAAGSWRDGASRHQYIHSGWFLRIEKHFYLMQPVTQTLEIVQDCII